MGKEKFSPFSQCEEAGFQHDAEYVEAFQIFLDQHYGESLEALLYAEDEAQHYPLIVE